MREKYMKYLHLINDKNLIGKQIPKESDLKNFERWKKRWRKYALKDIILCSIIILFVYSFFFIVSMYSETGLKEKIVAIIFLFIFVYVEYHFLIKKYLNAKSWKMEYCDYGKVLDKYKIHNRYGDSHNKEHYIIVQVNDNRLKFNITAMDYYYLLDIGDNVIVFSIEGHSQAYVAKND